MDTWHSGSLRFISCPRNSDASAVCSVTSVSNLSSVQGKSHSVYDSIQSMAVGFGAIFPSYFVGLATSLFLRAYAEHLKRKELAKGLAEVEIPTS